MSNWFSQWLWTMLKHNHPNTSLFRDSVCSGCGHLILTGQVRNKEVHVLNRQEGWEQTKTYGESCAPAWDMEEIGIAGEVRHYKEGKLIGKEG